MVGVDWSCLEFVWMLDVAVPQGSAADHKPSLSESFGMRTLDCVHCFTAFFAQGKVNDWARLLHLAHS